MDEFPFLDETNYGFVPAATTPERAKAETATIDSAHSFVGINARVK